MELALLTVPWVFGGTVGLSLSSARGEGIFPQAWNLCAVPCREPGPGHARHPEAEQEEEEPGHCL